MSVSIVSGDLLDATELYIGHQCNCITSGRGAGLAKVLFEKFPYANTYAQRKVPSEPGSYSVHGAGKDRRLIANFYAQYYPGKPKQRQDTKDQRLEWLISSMDRFVRECGPSEFALPYGIGCGLAGGNWETYHEALKKFAGDRNLKIRLYKLSR
jgi:O-acetyl-ADP-ribose deacetylase (regulator of RNase III)